MSLAEEYRYLIADVYELAGLSRRTSGTVARQEGQTVARWHVLSVLSGGPHTVPAVAGRLGLSRQSVQRVVDELHVRGMVDREPNPAHARSPLFALADPGWQALSRIVAESDIARTAPLARSGVTKQELQAARLVLRRLIAAVREDESHSPQQL